MVLINFNTVSMAFNDTLLLDGINLHLEGGERLCLMGRNGSGKSTLLKLISGELIPDSGEIYRQQGLRVALVSQNIPETLSGTIHDVVSGVHQETELVPTQDEHHPQPYEIERVLSSLGLDPDSRFVTLSGGTKRRTLLARALISSPDILLLDEPTNHLDIDTIVWLEEFLLKKVKTFVIVTHDRVLARRISNRIAELDRGRLFSFSCGYDEFVTRREDLLAAEITSQSLFDRKLSQEEAWVRQGIKARRTRNEGRVRTLEKLREERRNRRERTGSVRIQLQEAERSGKLILEAQCISFGYDDKQVVRDMTTTIIRGDRVGIIGPNGSGKTTLLRLFTGDLTPQQGRIRFGTRLEVVYFDQLREQLELDASVQENVGQGADIVTVNGQPRHVLGYLRDFLFTAERARSPVRILSGGEKNRLLLARLFTRPSNVLVMDEPTNDLDAETLELLEEILQEYAGTLLLVSHDREFLNHLVTSTMVIDKNGHVLEYAGGYDDWVSQSAAANRHNALMTMSARKNTVAVPHQTVAKIRKLTFKENRELEELPQRIIALEEEQAALHQTQASPVYYRTSRENMIKHTSRLKEIEQELTAAYHRWEELETINSSNHG